MANPFVPAPLNTTDVDKAKKFYGQLFTRSVLADQLLNG